MRRIDAEVPLSSPPLWAILERALIDTMSESVFPFLEKYTREDGTLIWRDEFPGIDGLDDAHESFHNWPLLYALGGRDHLSSLSMKEYDAITRQFTKYGQVYKEYEQGYDWFHQGEGYIYFYFLGLADPTRPKNIKRARRFAGFYLNEDPELKEPIYDPKLKIIRASHVGSRGPNFHESEEHIYGWAEWSAPYGLPFEDIPGIASFEDLKDPEKARRMGEMMHERWDRGDVAQNLAATSLITNAYLYTGDEKYRQWVLEYVDAWIKRTRQNNGIIPDNVGLSGRIGEYMDGKWWGGRYGWRVYHGFLNIGTALLAASFNALLLTGEERYLELARSQIDVLMKQGVSKTTDGKEKFFVPYKHGDKGWFEYQPTGLESHYLSVVAHLWSMSMDTSDWERIEKLRALNSSEDWNTVATSWRRSHCHEAPWLRFIAGENPDYPEKVLLVSLQRVYERLDMVRKDKEDLTKVSVHHWQERNPVKTEALVQLTLGAPGIIYFGGLLPVRIRYFDLERKRPGLPPDVSALVEKLEAKRTVLTLINLNPRESRDVVVQAGAFGEHQFSEVRYKAKRDGSSQLEDRKTRVDEKCLHVHMLPATKIGLDLETELFVNRPTYAFPWK
ncbi:MAG: hypothetical protein OEY31_03385 [Candidatus Bathyarchaeota archaeon]|nr:hypothetical protein [Candidatus Bathyarchaeota archaeon]